MRREEAKTVLYEWQKSMVDHGVPIDTSKVQALRMAIEALQAQPAHGRPIDADALMEAVDRIGLTCDGGVDINDLEGIIQEMAGSDRPHWEWIETTSGTICSNCGEYPYDDGEYHIANWHSNFCPNCGADMRGGK